MLIPNTSPIESNKITAFIFSTTVLKVPWCNGQHSGL